MQRVNLKVKMWQTMLSMFLASMAALLISTAPAYADEPGEVIEGFESEPIVLVEDAGETAETADVVVEQSDTVVVETEDAIAEEAVVEETPAVVADEQVSEVAVEEVSAPVEEAVLATPVEATVEEETVADSPAEVAAVNEAAAEEPEVAATETAEFGAAALAIAMQEVADPEAAEALTQVSADGAQTIVEAVNNIYTITEDGEYVLSGKGDTSVSIIGAIKVFLALNNVDINVGKNLSAINISEGAEVSIAVVGDCSLTGHNGIHVPGGTTVDISGASGKYGSDSLVANGLEQQGCGIGHYYKDGFSGSDAGSDLKVGNAGNITIHDIASVEAHGAGNNQGGVGIGGGRTTDETQGKVVIRNVQNVTATAVSKAAAIGAGFWRNTDVTIENCDSVVAFGGNTAAAIGTSRNATKAGPADNPAMVSNVSIINSNVIAEGGASGAGIGSGYQDLSIGDFSRDATDSHTVLMNVSITGNSVVIATGGKNAAGIGGGYKDYSPNIFIGAGTDVTAYAGAREASGSKVPEAIGSGSDGSGIFSDAAGSIVIEDGATVHAYGYGYDAVVEGATDGKGVLGSKWAIGRELDATGSGAVAVLRFLDRDYYGEEIEGMEFFVANGGNLVFREANTGEEFTVKVPAGYTSIGVTLPAGTYLCFVEGADGELFSFLNSEGYSAVSHGEYTGRTRQVYGDEGIDQDMQGSYADYTYEYQAYVSGSSIVSDYVTVHYAFGTYDAGFTVNDGIVFFDAVAVRPNAPITVPEPEVVPDPEPEPEPAPAPDPDPTPDPEPGPTDEPDPDPVPVPGDDPEPTPEPVSDPEPEPAPAPEPEPAPAPTPEPVPVVPVTPEVTPVTPAVQAATETPAATPVVTPAAPVAAVAAVAPAAAPAAAPVAAAPAVEVIVDDGVPLAGAAPLDEATVAQIAEDLEVESILDDENPLAGLLNDEDCWVHWWILLGIILTAAYSSVVVGRRSKNSHDLKKMDDNTMSGEWDDSRIVVPPTPARNLGPQPAMVSSTEA